MEKKYHKFINKFSPLQKHLHNSLFLKTFFQLHYDSNLFQVVLQVADVVRHIKHEYEYFRNYIQEIGTSGFEKVYHANWKKFIPITRVDVHNQNSSVVLAC